MSLPYASYSAASMPASLRVDSLWEEHTRTSYSTPLTSTSPDVLEPSTERRSVSFREPSHIPKYDPHSGRYADLESDYDRHCTGFYSRDKQSTSVRADTSWTEASTQDATIQLEFNCSEDIESYLEELSRLRRIGRYNDARQYFNTCRAYCGDHPELIIDYIDTLLAQEAFKDVLNLATDKNTPILSQDCDKIYHHYLHSSLCVARAITLGWLEEAVWEWRKSRAEMLSELERDFTKLSPLQIRFLCHLMHLETSYTTIMASPCRRPEFEFFQRSRWDELYTHLFRENRVWDMHDIFYHILGFSGVKKAIVMFFGTEISLDSSIDKLVIQWTQGGDESTLLAILDMLVMISLHMILLKRCLNRADKQTIHLCMNHAREIAISIRDNHLASIKSSPYLRWILAEVRVADTLGENIELSRYSYLDTSGGALVFEGRLPIYVPIGSENPGWVVTTCSAQYNELLHLGLNTARDLGDYGLEVCYLEELVLKSEAPQIYLTDLTRLQKDVIGDKSGYLRACLAKYLFVTEQEEQTNLCNELKEIDREETTAGPSSNPTLRWYQRKIQRALCSSLGLSKEQQDLFSWMEKSAYHELPRDVSNRYKLLHSTSRNDSYYWCEGGIATYTRDDRASQPHIPGNPFAPNPSSGLSFFPDREDFIEYSSYIRPFMPQPYNMGPNQTEPIRRNYSPHREYRPLNIRSRESIPPEQQITREESVEIEKAQQLTKETKERDSSQISHVEDQ